MREAERQRGRDGQRRTCFRQCCSVCSSMKSGSISTPCRRRSGESETRASAHREHQREGGRERERARERERERERERQDLLLELRDLTGAQRTAHPSHTQLLSTCRSSLYPSLSPCFPPSQPLSEPGSPHPLAAAGSAAPPPSAIVRRQHCSSIASIGEVESRSSRLSVNASVILCLLSKGAPSP